MFPEVTKEISYNFIVVWDGYVVGVFLIGYLIGLIQGIFCED